MMFTIRWHDDPGRYTVSVPNYDGGTVVTVDEYDEVCARLATAFALLHAVRPIIGSDGLHDRVEAFLVGDAVGSGQEHPPA
jgi:hypothetical protein